MGAGYDDLGAASAAADFHHVHFHALSLGEYFTGDLFAGRKEGVGGLRGGADTQAHIAVARIDARDRTGENLMFLAGELVVDHVALGFLQPLDDDLLTVAGSDAAEFHIIYGQTDRLAPPMEPAMALASARKSLPGFSTSSTTVSECTFSACDVLVHTHQNLFHIGVVVLVGVDQGLGQSYPSCGAGNTFFFFQHIQCGKISSSFMPLRLSCSLTDLFIANKTSHHSAAENAAK